MDQEMRTLQDMYDGFNARAIERVLAVLTDDVAWANGMEGGHAHGVDAVRDYWTRQWAIVSPRVVPVKYARRGEGVIAVTVEQSIRDLDGKPLQDEGFGLQDKLVGHVFRFADGKVCRFDIEDAG
jgi:nuclear transport factor 2 (NTF2) superfamily protein